jgi:hypothetical protein
MPHDSEQPRTKAEHWRQIHLIAFIELLLSTDCRGVSGRVADLAKAREESGRTIPRMLASGRRSVARGLVQVLIYDGRRVVSLLDLFAQRDASEALGPLEANYSAAPADGGDAAPTFFISPEHSVDYGE